MYTFCLNPIYFTERQWRMFLMANFTAVFEKLDAVDAAVAAVDAKIDELRAGNGGGDDQANVDSAGVRLDAIKAGLEAAIADPVPEPPVA